MDNLAAHKDGQVRTLIEQRGATLHFLPPDSYDFNPIEPAWALIKKRIRSIAPRTAATLRSMAQRAFFNGPNDAISITTGSTSRALRAGDEAAEKSIDSAAERAQARGDSYEQGPCCPSG